ncbi:coiled-coil domain-containing protein 13-like isoform X1 [Arapaima gigas]
MVNLCVPQSPAGPMESSTATAGRWHSEGERIQENLRLQFQALQDLQLKQLQKRLEKKKVEKQEQKQEEKASVVGRPLIGHDGLKLPELNVNLASKRLVQEKTTPLQDESSRLPKAVIHKDLESKNPKQDDKNRLVSSETTGLSEDAAAAKIVDLAKKNKELAAAVKQEEMKVKQANIRVKDLEQELQDMLSLNLACGNKKMSAKLQEPWASQLLGENPEVKTLQEKLSAANFKITEYRNQVQAVKQELKIAHKVLSNEVGEEVSVQQLLSSPGTWRGRSQQILALQTRVRELEQQLGQAAHRRQQAVLKSAEDTMGVAGMQRSPFPRDKNVDHLRNMEREKREALERITDDYESLLKEHEEVKKKLDASKARNQILSTEVKSLKSQITALLDKGQHDNELVDTLQKQMKKLQEALKTLSQQHLLSQETQKNLEQRLSSEAQRYSSLLEQLRLMLAERELKINNLEKDLRQLRVRASLLCRRSFPEPLFRKDLHGWVRQSRSCFARVGVEQQADSGCAPCNRERAVTNEEPKPREEQQRVGTAPPSGSTSASGLKPDLLRSLQAQCRESQALHQAASVERDKLLELVKVHQGREQNAVNKVLEAERKLQEELRRGVFLEQQLAKSRIDQGTEARTRGGTKGRAGPGVSTSWTDLSPGGRLGVTAEAQLNELKVRLDVQQEESEALRAALRNLRQAREEDLRLYGDVMDRVKQVFLQALRQHRQESGARVGR